MMECSEKEVNICESSCDEDEDEEHATQKSEMEQARVCPLVFCLHCTQMVSNTTFYRHQGLYEQSEAESSSGKVFLNSCIPLYQIASIKGRIVMTWSINKWRTNSIQ